MDSLLITFTGKSSVLDSVFFPPIELNGEYQIGFASLQTYNSIHNVNKPDNVLYYYEPIEFKNTPKGSMTLADLNSKIHENMVKLSFKYDRGVFSAQGTAYHSVVKSKGLYKTLSERNWLSASDKVSITENLWYVDHSQVKEIKIPEGNYEIEEIEEEVQKTIPDFKLWGNNILMKCYMQSPMVFDFTKGGVGQNLLGFNKYSQPGETYEAHQNININHVNVIRLKCSIASGSYTNGKLDQCIHSFFPLVPPGYKMVEVPKNIIYLPINIKTLDIVRLSIVDQNDEVIDFNGEEITVTCHIKKL